MVELMVAMFLLSLLMVSVVSSNLFVERFLRKWQDNNAIFEEGNFLLSTITNDLKSSNGFAQIDSATFIVYSTKIDTIKYSLDGGNLLRNRKVLSSHDIFLKGLKIERKDFEKSSPDSILISGLPRFRESLALVELKIALKKSSESFSTCVRIKNVCQVN